MLLAHARDSLIAAGFSHVDYLELVDAATLRRCDHLPASHARILVAAKIGNTRLIDNISV